METICNARNNNRTPNSINSPHIPAQNNALFMSPKTTIYRNTVYIFLLLHQSFLLSVAKSKS